LSLPRPKSTVVFKEMPQGAILFCTATETYFSLNPVGVQIWGLLPPVCTTLEEIVGSLVAEHPEVAMDAIRSDVASLLQELLTSGLVELPQAA